MNYNQLIIKNIHKIFRRDPYIQAFLGASDKKLSKIENKINSLSEEFWFDSMSSVGVAIMEEQLDYSCMSTTLENKRQELEARWKTACKCDLKLLQVIADTWRNGEVAIMFTNAVIEITFISITGIPNNVKTLKTAIEEAKPAHLPVNFTFRYRTWGQLPPKTWGYYSSNTWQEIMEKEVI